MRKSLHTVFMIGCFLCGWFLDDIVGCAKEHSCEGCYDRPYNPLITTYKIHLTNQNVATWIYPACKQPHNPGHYQIFDSIKPVQLYDSIYSGSYNLLDYFDSSYYNYRRGDTFFVYYEIRTRTGFTEQVQHDTLIY